jgi:signal transduction histidine kinase/CheY-like chemotaxis protein
VIDAARVPPLAKHVRDMKLRTKTTLIVSSCFSVLVAVLFAAALFVVQGRFRVLEADEALRNCQRANDALLDQVSNLAASTGDWAHWDDAARFVQGRMPQFVAANLTDYTFLTLRLDVIAYFTPDGRTVYQRWFDRTAHVTGRPLEGFAVAVASGAPLVKHGDKADHREGLLVLPGALMLVASQPVTDSLRVAPAVGTLVFGRILDAVEMARLSGIVQQETRLMTLDDNSLQPEERQTLEKPGGAPARPIVHVRGPDSIRSLMLLRDVAGSAAVLTVDAPRPLHREGTLSIRYLVGALVASCVMTAVLLFLLLNGTVLSPLARLGQAVRRIGTRGRSARLPVRGRDELADLAGSINGMLDALAQSQGERILLEEKLAHAQKLEAIGTLAGGIAHDFNNILMAIHGFCDLLEDSRGRGETGGSELDEIRKASARAGALTSQLLAFSRRQRLQFVVLDFNALLSDMAGMLRRLMGDHILLELALQDGPAAVKADFGQLQQMVMNLAVNARDAMPAGGTLTVRTMKVRVEPGPLCERLGLNRGEYVHCTVSDTGIGMPEEVRARVFEPFFSTKEPGRGTGLGLSVVWGIVKQCEGAVEVASPHGRGTTFSIWLPVSPGQVTTALPPASPASATRSGEGCSVLIAEDDRAIRQFLVRTLSKAGYTTYEAADGEEALRLAAAHGAEDFQLLLSDVVMPRMGGAILASQLRERYPWIRVLFISGNPDLMAAPGTVPATATILQKPFDTRHLLLAVQAALDARAAPLNGHA